MLSCVIQLVLGILVSLQFEANGRERLMCFISIGAYWLAAAILIARRPMTPSRWDLAFIRFGVLPLFASCWFLVPVVWHARGY